MDKNRYLHSLQHLSTIRVSVELGLCVQVSGEPADYLLTQSIPGETDVCDVSTCACSPHLPISFHIVFLCFVFSGVSSN